MDILYNIKCKKDILNSKLYSNKIKLPEHLEELLYLNTPGYNGILKVAPYYLMYLSIWNCVKELMKHSRFMLYLLSSINNLMFNSLVIPKTLIYCMIYEQTATFRYNNEYRLHEVFLGHDYIYIELYYYMGVGNLNMKRIIENDYVLNINY